MWYKMMYAVDYGMLYDKRCWVIQYEIRDQI